MKTPRIVIVGGGPVGTTLAIALSSLPLHVTLIEANPITTEINIADRPLSLTYSSQQFFSQLNIWSQLAAHAIPIESVHISDRGHFGFTRINARNESVAALGYVVPATVLAKTLNQHLLSLKQLQLLHPAKVQTLEFSDQQWQIQVQLSNKTQTIAADLVIAADGTHSQIRKFLNITTESKDYQQSALVTTLHLNRDHKFTAYERFTEHGAIAMLPLKDKQVGCVWTGATDQITALQHMQADEFLKQLQDMFGYRLGRFLNTGERTVHPLKKVFAKEIVREGMVLMGNAAHTLHPVAAQGFNLGLGDIALLTKIINSALAQNKNPGNLAVLNDYAQQRQQTVNWMMRFTDTLTQVFSNDFFPLTLARDSGLLALDFIPPLKKRLAKRLMGVV